MNKIVMLVTTLASTFYMGSYGMYALTQRVITKQPQSLMMHPGCMKWSSGRTMSTCMNHADEQEIQPQVLVETKSVEQMFPYLCKLGKNSPLLAVTRKKDFFSNVAYANIYNSTTYARDARKLLVLEDRLKRTAEKGEKAFVLRTDFLKNMIKNPTNISVAPVWENFGFIMTAPVITPVVAALNYYLYAKYGTVLDQEIYGTICSSLMMGLGIGISPVAFGLPTIAYFMSEDRKQNSMLIAQLLCNKSKAVQFKEMSKYYALADTLYNDYCNNKKAE